jgi:transposase
MEQELIKWMLPAGLLEHFEVEKIVESTRPGHEHEMLRKVLTIHLVEKNILPAGFSAEEYESKGFTDERKIADFPIRGKAVYLSIRRRRWRHKQDKNKVIQNDLSFIADGTRMTEELAAFLKDAR